MQHSEYSIDRSKYCKHALKIR